MEILAALIDGVGTFFVVSGLIGVAAMGLADALKVIRPVSLAGFRVLFEGRWSFDIGFLDILKEVYARAYGAQWRDVLEAAWRSDRAKGDLPRLLRQGARLGTSALASDGQAEIERIAATVGIRDPSRVVEALTVLVDDRKSLLEEQRVALGRFEAAIDARIDSALGLAEFRYQRLMQILAGVLALTLAFVALAWVGSSAPAEGGQNSVPPGLILLAGLLAVPLAPVAKDITKALDEAVQRLRR